MEENQTITLDLQVDGIIELDTKIAKQFGFTSDKFNGYLWRVNNTIVVSLIESKYEGKGNVRQLLQNILHFGYDVFVPLPFTRMRSICQSLGFEETTVQDKEATVMGMHKEGRRDALGKLGS